MFEGNIVIKKVKKVFGYGYYGGVWKVVYVDFVMVMMVFFFLMWLINVMFLEQKEGIVDYFVFVVVSESCSGLGGVLGGQFFDIEGVCDSGYFFLIKFSCQFLFNS